MRAPIAAIAECFVVAVVVVAAALAVVAAAVTPFELG
jgi:hypothetical protein